MLILVLVLVVVLDDPYVVSRAAGSDRAMTESCSKLFLIEIKPKLRVGVCADSFIIDD